MTCLCIFIGAAFFFVVIETSHSMGRYADKNGVAYDVTDAAQVARDVAYARTLDVPALTKYFKEISDDAGAAYAYEILRQLPQSDFHPYIHLFGHIIGDELFDQQNIEGLSICTTEFSFACYHSVIARAIAEEGFENIGEINKRCLKLRDVGSCQHGIGHGIMAAIAYGDPVAAIAVCDSLEKRPGVTRPCAEGVLMEFNFHQLEDTTEAGYRQVDERGYYYPCTDMPDAYTSECYFEQTNWWRNVLGRSNYPAIGALCDAVENDEDRAWCYRGIGRLIPEYSTDSAEVMASSCIGATAAEEGQALCLQELREVTKANTSLCDRIEGPYADVCRMSVPELVIASP